MKYSVHAERAKLEKKAQQSSPTPLGAFGKIAHRCASDRYALQVSAYYPPPLLMSESYI